MPIYILFLFFALLLISMQVVAFLFFFDNAAPLTIIVVETLWALSLFFLFILYKLTVLPLRSIARGMDLLREQDFNSQLLKTGVVEADAIVTLFNRLMEQLKNNRLRVREQNYFMDLLIEASPLGVVILNLDGSIESLNNVAEKLLGSWHKGALLKSLTAPLSCVLVELGRGEEQVVRLSNAELFKCTHLSFVDRGFPRSFYLLETLTQIVFESERNAYEQVIRTISHEVNNTMGGVACVLDTVHSVMQDMSGEREFIDLVQLTGERCYNLSRFISSFAEVVKIPEPLFRNVRLNSVVSNLRYFAESIGRQQQKKILWRVELSEHDPMASLDEVLFEQMILNIVKNGIDAIKEHGEIVITTTAYPSGVVIENNGKPISPQTMQRLFTPFFSTKPTGYGIGLVFVRSVLEKHKFSFSLQTEADGRTRFRINCGEI